MPAILSWLTLCAGLLFTGLGFWIAVLSWPQLAHLPHDPQAFAQGLEQAVGGLDKAMMPLGAVIVILSLLDAARHTTLRARRVIWRLVALGCVFGLAISGAVWIDPLLRAAMEGVDASNQLELAFVLQQLLFLATAVAHVAAHRSPSPAPIERGERYAARWVPPIFGRTPELPARQWRFLGLMIAASFFNTYDMNVFGLALKQIQEGLAIPEGQLGFLGSAIGLGVVPGVLLALAADTWGRRRVLLITIVGYTLFTGLTALSPNDTVFLVFQICARAFGAAELVLAMVVVAEEIDPKHRGWALGVLGSLALMGAGLALVLFAFVEVLPLGWRSLYLVGFGPLLVLAWLRRRLPETEKFERYAAAAQVRPTLAASLRPLVSLVQVYPRRFAAISSVRFLNAFATQAAGLFLPKYLQDAHGWDPERFAIMGGLTGFVALCAMPLLGRMGDRIGRKPVSIVCMLLVPIAIVGLYSTAGLFVIPLLWLAMSVSDGGADLNVTTFSNELFPTSYRSTASSARQLVGQIGGSLGLALESVLYAWVGSHALAISIVALPALLMPVIVAFGIPETSGRTLDEIAPEPAPPADAAHPGWR